jgi:hypothetical protein
MILGEENFKKHRKRSSTAKEELNLVYKKTYSKETKEYP